MDSAPTPSRPISLWLAPALLLALGLLVILSDAFGLQTVISNRLFDTYQRHAARPFADVAGMPVRVLELPSLGEDRLVEVARIVSAQGARMIVLTAPIKAAPSPQSLSARLPPGNDAVRAALARLPEPGQAFASALAVTKGVLPVLLDEPGRAPRLKSRFVYRGTRDPFGQVPRFHAASGPPAILETSAAGLAAPNLLADSDGIVRRMPVVFRMDTLMVPGLAAEALRVASGKPQITLVSNEHDLLAFLSGVGIAALETANGPVPTAADGQIRLHYAANISQRMLNPVAPGIRPLKDAIVVVGLESDVVKTPLGPASLASVTADAIENLAGGTALTRPAWAMVSEAILLAALGAAMTFLLCQSLGWAAALAMASPALLGWASWYFYAAHGILIDAATPVLFLLLAFAAGAIAWLYHRQLTYTGLRAAFSNSLPRAVLDRMARRSEMMTMAGETRTITCLVCEIRGLTADDAAAFASRMQKFLAPLIQQTVLQGGTIDRPGANGFTAFWNAPLEDDDHAAHACAAAHAMTSAATQAALELADQAPEQSPAIAVGIATGAVVAGGFGGPDRPGYGIHGDAVALAQDIHALSSRYGAGVIVADRTKRLADLSFAFLEIDSIAARGAPVSLYALMGDTAMRGSPKFRALSVFHDHIFQAIRKQNWRVARELIAQCRRLSGANQKLYDLHLARIAYYETHPPGADWDGAFRPILE